MSLDSIGIRPLIHLGVVSTIVDGANHIPEASSKGRDVSGVQGVLSGASGNTSRESELLFKTLVRQKIVSEL